jgi:chorismate synthase
VYSENKKILISANILEVGGNKDVNLGIQSAIENNDSIGGIVRCVVSNLSIGLGEPFFDSLESLISHAVFSIPAIKGIEFGSGFASARMKGSEHNDPMVNASGKTDTNNAGGIVGGLSNGNELVFRVAVKPTSSTPATQFTYNSESDKVEEFKVEGRHDLCIALRVPVVIEAATACVIADLLMLNR